MKVHRRIPQLLILAALAALAGCNSKKPTVDTATPAAALALTPWGAHVERFEGEYFEENPSFAVSQGRHEFDGKLPDWSANGIKKEIAWLADSRERTLAFDDAKLSAQERFEKQYLLAVIDGDLFWLKDAGRPFLNPAHYVYPLDPSVYITRPYAPAEQRIKAFIAYLKAVPAAAAQIRANLRTPMPRTLIDYGVGAFGGYAEFYQGDAIAAFATVKDQDLQAQLKQASTAAARSMQALADWLKSEQKRANENYAIGAEKFSRMLAQTERVDTPLDKLKAIGEADLERNTLALQKACEAYLPKESIDACVAAIAKDKPTGGPVEGARAQLAQLRQFIYDKQLVSIPGKEVALVEEAPAYNRANFAYIDVPGPYDRGMPSVYYIAPPDPAWPKAEQEAYLPGKADLLATSVHEVWPGHFLQFLHANRSPSQFGQLFVGYAFAEGWAHYGEEMMIEAGLAEGHPEIEVGQVLNALLRDVRYLCAIGLHTQGMSVQACETMFREKAHQDPGNARQQAARGTYDPAYLNYTLGKLMIRKLREDWTPQHSGRQGWSAFHDQLLSFGGPPLPLVRAQMMGGAKGDLF